ncbi:hypothetical protein JCM8547_004621 [Rhodosporidiobolus lusitaniae]
MLTGLWALLGTATRCVTGQDDYRELFISLLAAVVDFLVVARRRPHPVCSRLTFAGKEGSYRFDVELNFSANLFEKSETTKYEIKGVGPLAGKWTLETKWGSDGVTLLVFIDHDKSSVFDPATLVSIEMFLVESKGRSRNMGAWGPRALS